MGDIDIARQNKDKQASILARKHKKETCKQQQTNKQKQTKQARKLYRKIAKANLKAP